MKERRVRKTEVTTVNVALTQMARNRTRPWKPVSLVSEGLIKTGILIPTTVPLFLSIPSPFNQTLQRDAQRREL
jgi:hypothetical protein